MVRRYVSIWFRYLHTDWFSLRQRQLKKFPFVLRSPSHGRMIVTAANAIAEESGVHKGMVLADARAIVPGLQVLDDQDDLSLKLLKRLAEWSIRFTPAVAMDLPDGLILDATGCTHLWGGDECYVSDIKKKLNDRGYEVRVAMADTIALAWGVARYGNEASVIEKELHIKTLMGLPPEALRLEEATIERLHKLGLHKVEQFIGISRTSLRKRFGQYIITRLNMALGQEIEVLEPVHPVEPYQERLPSFEPVVTASGIELALRRLLEALCLRLRQEQKGLRTAVFKCLRVDGKMEQIEIGTNRPSHHIQHLYKLFEVKISSIEPALGIELFILEAPKVEAHLPEQSNMWEGVACGLDDIRLSELLDRLATKVGIQSIHRYLPDEHYWPERSVKVTSSLQEKPTAPWPVSKPRPLQVLSPPERIEVTAPIPDYPPMLFRYKGQLHKIIKADGPERIEQEWWLQQGQHRDYYYVEDEDGNRYWLFRLGHYHDKSYQWFIHGFFA